MTAFATRLSALLPPERLLWEPAQGSVEQRSDEWLGLFCKAYAANTTPATH